MEITTEQIKELRQECGAGVMDCRNALKESNGDKAKALKLLQEQGYSKAQKTAGRVAKQGLVVSYIHAGGRIGSLVELNCETDFVARTSEFKDLAYNIAMQVAAMDPQYLSKEEEIAAIEAAANAPIPATPATTPAVVTSSIASTIVASESDDDTAEE